MQTTEKNNKNSNDGDVDSYRAVVDIGSNSVRLVIFDGPARAPIAICNEKALCGLGRDMLADGSLNPASIEAALTTLKRFRIILRAYGDPHTQTIATAAVRDAKDGEAFVAAVRALGYDIKVISGAEEADLAARGVIAVEPNASGLAGDMGGGSLELVSIEKGATGQSVSLPIGPLSIMRASGGNLDRAQTIIEDAIRQVKFLRRGQFKTLYTVGGAWRSIARIHMNLKQYPLSVLHHYILSSSSVIEVCDLVARQSRRSLEEIPGISRKRIDTLPLAAIALKELLLTIDAKSMVVSSGGVREGLLYNALDPSERDTDPLLEACRFFSSRFSPDLHFGEAALGVVKSLFEDDPAVDHRILKAATTLVDIAAYAHPDMRGRQAFDTALSAPFVSVTHKERIWIALALYCRYCGRNAQFPNEQAISLLDWEEQQAATRAGLAIRFAATLAPKSPSLLKGCALRKTPDSIVFSAPTSHESLIGETPRKRLESLAGAFELPLVLKFEG